jgi:hypothetical protein
MSLKMIILALGLQNKRDVGINQLTENEINVCCLQEKELEKDFPA